MKQMQSSSAIWEWITIAAVAAAMIVVSEQPWLRPRWGNALLYTVVLFTIFVVSFHYDWRRAIFWKTLGLIFSMHTLTLVVLVQTMPNSDHGIAGLPMTLTALAEGALILWVMWNRGAISKPTKSDD